MKHAEYRALSAPLSPGDCVTPLIGQIVLHYFGDCPARAVLVSAFRPVFMSDSANTDPQACTEAQVKAALARSPVGAKLSRWVSVGKGSIAAVRRPAEPSSVALHTYAVARK